jgi:hypothetical protein
MGAVPRPQIGEKTRKLRAHRRLVPLCAGSTLAIGCNHCVLGTRSLEYCH